MPSFTVDVNLDVWELLEELTDKELIEEMKSRGLSQPLPLCIFVPYTHLGQREEIIATLEARGIRNWEDSTNQ